MTRRDSRHPSRDTAGFSLIEVLIAITVFAVGILAVISMQSTSVGGNAKARYVSEASAFAADRMELLMNTAYSATDLQDTDANGLAGLDYGKVANSCCPGGKDPWNKVVSGCTKFADHCALPDPNYGIYWNVADDQPIINVKTVRAIVTSPLLAAPVILDFTKANAM